MRKSSSKGFFGSFEIRLALDLLRVIDNPYQDRPQQIQKQHQIAAEPSLPAHFKNGRSADAEVCKLYFTAVGQNGAAVPLQGQPRIGPHTLQGAGGGGVGF